MQTYIMIPTPMSKVKCKISIEGMLFFKINNISAVDNAFIRGKDIILKKGYIPHFVISKTKETNPKVDTKVLKKTAMDVPNMPQWIENV